MQEVKIMYNCFKFYTDIEHGGILNTIYIVRETRTRTTILKARISFIKEERFEKPFELINLTDGVNFNTDNLTEDDPELIYKWLKKKEKLVCTNARYSKNLALRLGQTEGHQFSYWQKDKINKIAKRLRKAITDNKKESKNAD